MRVLKPVLTNNEIEEILASEYCDAPVVDNETPYFMESILDIQLSEAEEVELWEEGMDVDNIIEFPSPDRDEDLAIGALAA